MGVGAVLAFAEFTQSWPWLPYAGVLFFSACGGLVPGRSERLLGTHRSEHFEAFGGELGGGIIADETFEGFDRLRIIGALLA